MTPHQGRFLGCTAFMPAIAAAYCTAWFVGSRIRADMAWRVIGASIAASVATAIVWIVATALLQAVLNLPLAFSRSLSKMLTEQVKAKLSNNDAMVVLPNSAAERTPPLSGE